MDTPQVEMTGHPESNPITPPPAAPQAQAPTTSEKPGFQPVYIGGRKFESSEALATYTAELDRQRNMWEKEQQFSKQVEAVSDPDKELADLMFEDTPAAIRLLTEKAERQATQKFEAKLAQQKAVDSFYQKFNDLKDFSDLVDLTATKLTDRIREMPQVEAMELIAKEARSRIASIKGTPTGGIELPSGGARVASGSGGPATPVQVTVETESLVDQIRRFQMRGKTKGGN